MLKKIIKNWLKLDINVLFILWHLTLLRKEKEEESLKPEKMVWI